MTNKELIHADRIAAPRPLPARTEVRRIAVLRANALGDLILALPALDALRRHYPNAHICLLGKAWHADFLQGRPGAVDEVVVLPGVRGITLDEDAEQDEVAIEAFCARMRARRFDLAIQLHGGGRNSNPFLKRLGARCTAGFATPDAEKPDVTVSYQAIAHQGLHMLECVRRLGAATPCIEPQLLLRKRDVEEADEVLPPSSRPLVIIQPAASDPRKCWSAQNFAAVADHFAERGADIAINGTDGEAEYVHAVMRNMRHAACDLTGRLSAGGLAGVISRARLVVSNDTGPAHLARALGVPSMTVIWLGNVPTYAPLNSQLHRMAVSWRMACPVCNQIAVNHDCGHADSFVDDVRAGEVISQADELFDLAASDGLDLHQHQHQIQSAAA